MKSYKDLVNEVLTKSTPAGEWIKDFIDSDNPKFTGKSPAKRKQMALAAYYAKQNESAAASQNSTAEVDMREAKEHHLVHVSDGSKYDEVPHPKDIEHVKTGAMHHGGQWDSHSDKGAFFKFKSKEDAQHFISHVNKCPHRTCDAEHVSEAVEYKGIGTDVVDKKKKLNPQPNLTTDKKTVKDFKEAKELDKACWKGYKAIGLKNKNGRQVPNCVPEEVEEGKVYDPFTKKMVNTKPIKVQAGGGATRNGVPVETGPSKHKQSLKNEGIELIAKHEVKADAPHKSGGHVILTKSSNKWHVLHNKKSSPEAKDLHRSKLLHSYADEKEARAKFKELHEEQIDEISKSTLMRYIPKASRDVGSHTYAGKEAGEWAAHYTRAGDWSAAEKQSKKSYADFKKANKRIAGIDTATKKLGTQKEEVELDEASHQVYDTKTQKVHSTHDTYKKAVNAAEKLNKSHEGYDTPGNIVKAKFGARTVKEEVQIDEATVSSRKYDWGTMKTVNHGKSFSIPLHPEHHEPISKLKHGESHSFKDETGRKWKATRDNDTVHFHGGSYGTQKTSVPHKSMTEETVEESRGHKVLATFFKNREVAQRAFQGNPAKDAEVAQGGGTPADQGIAAAKKDAEELKKKVNEAMTPSVQAPAPKKTKSTAKEYTKAPIPGTKRITRAKPDSNEPGEIKEDQYTSDYKIKYYVDPITGENKTRKIRPHRVNFKASKMRGEPVQQDAQGDYGMKEGYVTEGGFDNYHEIAKELIKRHGKNVDTGHINDIAGERDTHRGLDHSEVMHHVNKILGSKEVKEGDEYDEQWKEYKGKTFKKESRMINFKDYLKEAHLSAKQKKIAAIAGDKEKIDADDLAALRAGKKPVEEAKKCMDEDDMDESGLRMAAHAAHKSGKKEFEFQGKTYPVKVQKEGVLKPELEKGFPAPGVKTGASAPKGTTYMPKKDVKEEVEHIDEISKDTLASYIPKAAKSSRIHGMISKDYANSAERKRNPGLKSALDRLSKKYKSKAWKREDGIATAVKKLTKEDVQIDEGKMKDIYTSMMHHADKKGYSSHKQFTPADYDAVGKEHGISGKELAVIAGHKTAQQVANEAVDKVEKDASGKVKSWSHEGDWKKTSSNKEGSGKAANLAGQALKKTQQLSKEEVEQIEELDKKTLGSYVKKASADITKREVRIDRAMDASGSNYNEPSMQKALNKNVKRVAGLNKAADKLAKEEVEHVSEDNHAMSYVNATLAVMDEGKLDDLRDAQKLRAANKSAYDKDYKADTSHPHITTHKGTSYGGQAQKDDEGDEKKDDEKQEKRGRGRPSGSKSGARQKGNGREDGGIPVHSLHLPNRNK